MTFDVSNTLKLIRWWTNSNYSQKSNYYIHHYNNVADNEPGRIRITIKEG